MSILSNEGRSINSVTSFFFSNGKNVNLERIIDKKSPNSSQNLHGATGEKQDKKKKRKNEKPTHPKRKEIPY